MKKSTFKTLIFEWTLMMEASRRKSWLLLQLNIEGLWDWHQHKIMPNKKQEISKITSRKWEWLTVVIIPILSIIAWTSHKNKYPQNFLLLFLFNALPFFSVQLWRRLVCVKELHRLENERLGCSLHSCSTVCVPITRGNPANPREESTHRFYEHENKCGCYFRACCSLCFVPHPAPCCSSYPPLCLTKKRHSLYLTRLDFHFVLSCFLLPWRRMCYCYLAFVVFAHCFNVIQTRLWLSNIALQLFSTNGKSLILILLRTIKINCILNRQTAVLYIYFALQSLI